MGRGRACGDQNCIKDISEVHKISNHARLITYDMFQVWFGC